MSVWRLRGYVPDSDEEDEALSGRDSPIHQTDGALQGSSHEEEIGDGTAGGNALDGEEKSGGEFGERRRSLSR